jgi:TonB family protein
VPEPKEIVSLESAKKDPLPLPTTSKISPKKTLPPPFIKKETVFKENTEGLFRKTEFTKPALSESEVISVKKIITIPPLDLDKINNPSYVNYYQIVREKIRRAAYQNFVRTETGEVYVSFIVVNNGDLKDIRLITEKSSSNTYLQETALRSIKEASPFPEFPPELDYAQLSFNVVISFEIE